MRRGIDLNVQDVYGYTPLHYCKTGKGAKMLCACGAKYEIADKDGNTAQKHHAVSAICDSAAPAGREAPATA